MELEWIRGPYPPRSQNALHQVSRSSGRLINVCADKSEVKTNSIKEHTIERPAGRPDQQQQCLLACSYYILLVGKLRHWCSRDHYVSSELLALRSSFKKRKMQRRDAIRILNGAVAHFLYTKTWLVCASLLCSGVGDAKRFVGLLIATAPELFS